MQAPYLGDDGVVFRRVHDFDRLHVLIDDRHELRRGDTDGRCEELRRFRLIMLLCLQMVAHRVQARQPPSPPQPELRLPSVTAAMSATLGAELLNIVLTFLLNVYIPDTET